MSRPVYGWEAQLGIDTAWPVTKKFRFDNTTLVLDEEFADTNGMTGTTARSGELILPGRRRAIGQLTMQPTAVELALLLPWIMGGTPTGSGTVTYPLDDTGATDTNGIFGRPSRFIGLGTVRKLHKFASVAIDKAVFRGSGEGEQKLELVLDLVAIDETFPGGSFPSLNHDLTTAPFLFNMLALAVNSHTYLSKDAELTFDFAIDKDRFLNSPTLTALQTTNRIVSTNFNLPWGDAYVDYGIGVAGAAVSAIFTYGLQILTFPYNNVKFPRKGPQVQARNMEVMQRMEGIAYKTGTSTLECVPTLVTGL